MARAKPPIRIGENFNFLRVFKTDLYKSTRSRMLQFHKDSIFMKKYPVFQTITKEGYEKGLRMWGILSDLIYGFTCFSLLRKGE